MNKVIKRYFPILMLLTLLAFTMGFITPFLVSVYLSFCKLAIINDVTFIGSSNYIKVFTDGTFVYPLWYTVPFTIMSVILTNFFALLTAMLSTRRTKGTNIFRTISLMPNLIGDIILGYIWSLLLNGIPLRANKTLTYSPTYGFWGLIILMYQQQIGHMMIIYIVGIQNIPGDLVETVKIDEANNWDILKNMIVPMVMSSITVCTFLTLTNGLKLSDQNLVLTNGGSSNMSELPVLNIFRTSYGRAGRESVGQAKAVVFFILVAVIAIGQNMSARSKEVQQ